MGDADRNGWVPGRMGREMQNGTMEKETKDKL
jgi:hypothetical protein